MKKAICIITTLVMLLSCMFLPNVEVNAANISLGVSASSIKIGDSVSVTVSIPENVTGPVYIRFSNDILEFTGANVKDVAVNGANINISMGAYGLAGTNKATLTFKAKTSGSATISASHGDLYDDNSYAEVKLGSASTTITVTNQTTDAGNGGGTTEPQKSADNSLSSLKLSSGTLSPSFKRNVTKYTATVGYDVTKVVVSAKTSHEKATIESVTDNGTVNLKVGENTIKIVVKAENGVKATYTIVVTRKAQDTTTPDSSESESTSESETTTPEVNEMLQWNGEQLQATENIPAEAVPTGFESTLLVVNGQQMQGLSFSKADLKVLYLNNTNGAGALYVYDEAQQTIYPFIKITSEKSYVMVLLPDEANMPAPEGFESCTLSIEGKGIISAYQLAEAKASDFYLIYCMNDAGEKGWYMYDSVEGTFQRYLASAYSVQTGGAATEPSDTQDDYAKFEKELESAKMTQYIIIGIAAAVVIILIIVIIVLVLKNRNKEEDFFEEYEDEDYEEEDVEEIPQTAEIADVESVENEVYVDTMGETVKDPTSKLLSKKEDDDDLEFIDFE